MSASIKIRQEQIENGELLHQSAPSGTTTPSPNTYSNVWTGTKAEFDALTEIHTDWKYEVEMPFSDSPQWLYTSASTFDIIPSSEEMYVVFDGTTTTAELPAASAYRGEVTFINIGSGTATINTAAAANELYDSSTTPTNTISVASAAKTVLKFDGISIFKIA